MMKIDNRVFAALMLGICSLFGCTKGQYQGSHISEAHQRSISTERNNYYVKETQRIIDKHEKRNEKTEKKDEVARKKQMKTAISLKDNKRRSLRFNFY